MDLERELGVTLMLRGKNGLTLTDDGIFFRQRAEEIVQLADRLEQAFVRRNAECQRHDFHRRDRGGGQPDARQIHPGIL